MIEVSNLIKAYNGNRAVDDLSLHIGKGMFYGILGPNGAGKTTLINIITGVIKADRGKIRINGTQLEKSSLSIRSMIGYVPQDIALYDELSVLQNLRFWGRFFHLEPRLLEEKIDILLDRIGLQERRRSKIRDLSGGMKRRINLAAALIHEPVILVMDEPTVGIDPQSRKLIHNILEEIHAQGCTILYTSHYLDEFERLCDTIAIMDHGKVIASGTMMELKDRYAPSDIIHIELEKDLGTDDATSFLGQEFKFLLNDQKFLVVDAPPGEKTVEKLICTLERHNAAIRNLEIRKSNLESVFFKLTGTELRD